MAKKAIPVILLSALVILMISAIPASAQRGFQRGKVIDEAGEPIANITLSLDWQKEQRYDSKGNEHHETTSDAEGVFKFSKLNPGYWILNISAEGYAPFSKAYEILTLARNKNIQVILEKVTMENAAAAGDARAEGEAVLTAADALVAAGDFDGAIKIYQEFYEKYPTANMILVQIGIIHEKKGDKEAAINSFLDAIDADANNLAAAEKLGLIYAKDQDYAAAFPYYSQLADARPDDKTILYTAGQMANAVGEYGKCYEYFAAYAKLDTASAQTLEALMMGGFAASLVENHQGTVDLFEALLKLKPDHPYAADFKKEIEKAKAKLTQ